MAIEKGDFIELNYTGRVATGDRLVFDTTVESVAKEEGVYSPKTKYGSTIVAVGEGQLIPGIDKALPGKEVGKYSFHIEAEDAFGKKDAKLMRLVPVKFFKRDNVRPFVGLQVNIDDEIGVVRSVSGGRIIVDFNHPLSSKDVDYDVEVVRVVTDTVEQVEAVFALIGIKAESITAKDNEVTITTKILLPEQLTTPLANDIKRLVGATTVHFEVQPAAKK